MVSGFGRRDFLRLLHGGGLYALGGWGMPTSAKPGEVVDKRLLEAIEASDVARASAAFLDQKGGAEFARRLLPLCDFFRDGGKNLDKNSGL